METAGITQWAQEAAILPEGHEYPWGLNNG